MITLGILSPHAGANFGCALASFDDKLLVGAQNDKNNSGTVWVYRINSTAAAYALVQVLENPSSVSSGNLSLSLYFGSSLAFTDNDDSNFLSVGAPDGPGFGSVFTFMFDSFAQTFELIRTISSEKCLLPQGNMPYLTSGGVIAFDTPIQCCCSCVFYLDLFVCWTGINFGQSIAIHSSMRVDNILVIGANNDGNCTGTSFLEFPIFVLKAIF
jgi:hypothetical protein